MAKRETKYNKYAQSILTNLITVLIFNTVIIYLYIKYCKSLDTSSDPNLHRLYTLIFGVIVVTLVFGNISFLFGQIIAKINMKRINRKIEKQNKYLYYRELPNHFGIGVNTLLIDSKIENEKDIVAVILDLCAKKYLKLFKLGNKYFIQVLNYQNNQLLENEKYIMQYISQNKVKDINYNEWYRLCLEDGKKLDLYTDSQEKKNNFNFLEKFGTAGNIIKNIIVLLISILMTIAALEVDNPYSIISAIFSGIVCFIMLSFMAQLVYSVLYYIAYSIQEIINAGINSYNDEMSNNLKRTDKGLEEYYKLKSFANFLDDFGAFAKKEPEEIVLWDYYLSYAQVFGLTEKIMKTGYNKLINNSSFNIDDINNLTLSNIYLDNNKN